MIMHERAGYPSDSDSAFCCASSGSSCPHLAESVAARGGALPGARPARGGALPGEELLRRGRNLKGSPRTSGPAATHGD